MTGKALLDILTAGLTVRFAELLERIFGPKVQTRLFGSITWADVGVMLCFLLLVVLLNGAIVGFLRRRTREADPRPESMNWPSRIWRTLGAPLYFLLWVYGGYIAATPLLLKLPADEHPHPVWLAFDKLLELAVFVALLWASFKFTHVLEVQLKTWTSRTSSKVDDLAAPLLGRSLRVAVPVVGLILAMPMLGLSPESTAILSKASGILIIGAVAYILFHAVSIGEKAVLAGYDVSVVDNLQARKVHTQVQVLSKTIYFLIILFTVASVLMLFEAVRQFGTSILASAGVVGIIIGFAAQRTIANLFAGFQLAMTQPIRLDDVVIVENEWGRIEEITLTYVVVKIWDDRRLVVPLSYFIEKPFQNWTRMTSSLLGTVFVWADYTLPVAELRPAVESIVKACKDWDQRFWNLQVTDATERSMQIRVLATAADAGKAWNLRCEIREKLLEYIQQQYPQGLPHVRAEIREHR